ncbi:hypothetical protein [Achromobacter sp. MYb9]|uniref:MrpH family fimbial adhesin n=1 Tax=Achromobacter sp. MYb9 TaxID=1827284 RepID=UPI0011B26B11|nr:hypothetical protein [Achromobacter sp. MYb9]
MFKRLHIYKITFLIFLLSLSNLSYAIAITSTKSEYVPEGIMFYFTVSDWDSGGDKLCDDMSAVYCSIQLYGAQAPGESAWMIGSNHYWRVKPSRTMAGVLAQMAGFSIPFHGTLLVRKNQRISDSFCITFAAGYAWSGVGGAISPIGPCAKVTMPALQCDIQGNTTINHREIFSDAIDGNEAETQLQLTCTGATSVTATTDADDALGVRLRAGEGLYSNLTIDGKKTSSGVLIKVDNGLPTRISLKSTLVTKGIVKPGEFSGSTVLTISPP